MADRKTAKSAAAFERAQKVLVGGVNSPVRSFRAVGGTPPFIAEARGAHITDIDGNTYIDYVASYGPTILGHAAEQIQTAINKAVPRGTSYGAPTKLEVRMAEAVIAAMPSIQKIRFVSSGTEAVMSAVRLSRGATGRSKIVKFQGCYHGHADAMLVAAGSGATTLGVPSSPGVPAGVTADTITLPYNDTAKLRATFETMGCEIAAVLVEPVAGNMGVIPPLPEFLPALRELCDRDGALLIFDEVMTGFRLSRGGAQELFRVRPDLTTLGKIIGGGLPVGAFGGPADIMSHLAPEGPVYQAGTLSGNPAAMAAGLAALQALQEEGVYEQMEQRSGDLADGLIEAFRAAGLAGRACLNRVGSMMTVFFAPGRVVDYAGATASNTAAFAEFFGVMLDEGVYLPPSQFEAWFVSAAHTPEDISKTLAAAEKAFVAAEKLM